MFRQRHLGAQHVRGDGQHVLGFIVYRHIENLVRRGFIGGLIHHALFDLSFSDLAFGRQGHAPGKVPEDGRGLHGWVGLRQVQDSIPLLEPDLHGERHGHEAFQRRNIFHQGAHVRGQHAGGLVRFIVAAIHAGAGGDEMKIVAVIHGRIHAHGPAGLDVVAVRGRGQLVGPDGRFKIAGANVDVSGHVHQVSGGGDQRSQAIGGGQGALRAGRSLHGVNVIVDSAHVIGVAAQH